MVKVDSSVQKNRNTDLQRFSYHPVHPMLSQAAMSCNPALKFPAPYFKISQGFFMHSFYQQPCLHIKIRDFSCLWRFQPYTDCQLSWSKDHSKAPPRLSVQISDLYLEAHFLENAFWWCLLIHSFLHKGRTHTRVLRAVDSIALYSAVGHEYCKIHSWQLPPETSPHQLPQSAAGFGSSSGTQLRWG